MRTYTAFELARQCKAGGYLTADDAALTVDAFEPGLSEDEFHALVAEVVALIPSANVDAELAAEWARVDADLTAEYRSEQREIVR